MKILVLNSGSSSVKYKVFALDGEPKALVSGLIERIGLPNAKIKCECGSKQSTDCASDILGAPGQLDIPNHSTAIEMMCRLLLSPECGVIKDLSEIIGIGHRVVHGGEAFTNSVIIDDEVIAGIERCARLAPLHNPPALLGIRACTKVFGETPQVAVFDTAFHHSMQEKAFLYAIPRSFHREHGIRKYGFHGTSHSYVSQEAARIMGKPIENLRIVTCHLGNGSSITAVKGGRSIETSMGLTPLAGVMMGTRPGDLDPYIPIFMMKELGMSAAEVEKTLNKQSGFEGICRKTDVRDVERLAAEGDTDCRLALDMFAYRIERFIGSYAMVMGGVDAIVFTGGIGEHDAAMRARILADAGFLGVAIDPAKNVANALDISAPGARVAVLVIPTNEELVIARDTARLVRETATVTSVDGIELPGQ